MRNGATAIFILALALNVVEAPFLADAQQAAKVYRIGVLTDAMVPWHSSTD